jgi:hypothetical protein
LACAVVLLVPHLPAAAGAGTPSAVLVSDIHVQDVAGFGPSKVAKFSNRLDAVVAESGFATVPRSEIQSRLNEEQKESYRACYDDACQIELGKAVAAQKVLISSWARFGKECILIAKLYDLRSALTESSAEAKGECDEEGLNAAIEQIGRTLRSRIAASGRVRTLREAINFGGVVRNEDPDKRGFLIVRARTAQVTGDAGDSGQFVAATVFVDGNKPVGTTRGDRGWSSGTPLVAGVHRVVVTYEEEYWQHGESDVEIRDGETTEIELELQPRFGLLQVDTEPTGAQVEVNGRRASSVTPIRSLRVAPGEASLQIILSDYLPVRMKVSIVIGKAIQIERTLTADFGAIEVTSNPPGARILIDGVEAGLTPTILKRQATGRRKVELDLEGHARAGELVEVSRGKTTTVARKLQPYLGRLLVTSTLRSANGTSSDCRAAVTVSRGGQVIDAKTTPAEFRGLVAVEHEVEVVCDGLREKRTVEIKHNADVTVDLIIDERAVRELKEREKKEARETEDEFRRRLANCREQHTHAWCTRNLSPLRSANEVETSFRSDGIRAHADPKGVARDNKSGSGRLIAGISILALAVGAAVSAIAFGVKARNTDRELESVLATADRSSVRAQINAGKREALASDVLVGAAVVAGITGALVITF